MSEKSNNSTEHFAAVDPAVVQQVGKLNVIALLQMVAVNLLIGAALGFHPIVMWTLAIPVAGFIISFLLNRINEHGIGLLIVFFTSLIHGCILVTSYDLPAMSLIFFPLAVLIWHPWRNKMLLTVCYFLAYACFFVTSFIVSSDPISKWEAWTAGMYVYFFLTNAIFLAFYPFLMLLKTSALAYQDQLVQQKDEIESQNAAIKSQSEQLLKLEAEKHELKISQKKKDIELLQLNNELKVKMKRDLIAELEEIRKNPDAIQGSVFAVINRLKQQIEEEQKTGLIEQNLEDVGTDFKERIKERFPKLSKAEYELLAYIKMNLSNKQMAQLKNTSPNTINVSLHRLKNKCEFETTNELKEFVLAF